MRLVSTILVVLLFFSEFTFAQSYTYTNFGHRDGLSMANITTTFQSSDGLIWIGTDGAGLISYNGQEFKEFSEAGADNDHHITSIFELGTTLYFTSKYKGLFAIKGHRLVRIIKKRTDIGEFISAFENNHQLYIVTSRGIYKVKDENCIEIALFPALKVQFALNSIIPLEKGTILLTNKGNFYLSSNLDRLTLLNNWLHVSKESANFITFGCKNSDKLIFYDAQLKQQLEVILNERDGIYQLKFTPFSSPLSEGEFVLSLNFNIENGKTVALSNQNNLYLKNATGFATIPHNSPSRLEQSQHLMVDYNGDLWISSSIKGLYKASEEPFTKLHLHPLFSSTSIMTIFKSKNGSLLLSTFDNETSISNGNSLQFQTYKFQTTGVIELNEKLYLGTKEGLKIYNTKSRAFEKNKLTAKLLQPISLIFATNNSLWIGIAGKGLKQFDRISEKEITFESNKILPDYYYTAQEDVNGKTIYFGTNNGLLAYSIQTKQLKRIKTPKKLGSYFGVSTKDCFGNCWFTGEKGLVGILTNGTTLIINDPKLFSSTLFYTLNSDNYGNLILGTNKGLILLTINKHGKVLRHQWFQGKGGFEGYETHMRSQFQDKESILVGTIEGLYSINTHLLFSISAPHKPLIFNDVINRLTQSENTFHFKFSVNNPKIHRVLYSYRIPGIHDEWTTFDGNNELILTDLSSGNYTLEVRASYDGIKSSEISTFKFSVHQPFWKTRWFIFLLLVGLVVFNIYFISKNRTLSTGKIFGSNENSVILKMTPQAILFGLITDTATNLIGPLLDPSLYANLGLTLTVGFFLFALFLFAQSAKSNERQTQFNPLLALTFALILGHNFIGLYLSNIQPFYLLAVVLVFSTAPFIFNRIKTILVFTLFYVLISFIIALLIDTPQYSKPLFLIAVVISAVIAVFAIFLRFDSLEKLLFISGVINKGDVMAISFNSQGTITYASENLDEILDGNTSAIVGKHISFLNHFVPEEGGYRSVDLTLNFIDGKKYLTPMILKTDEIQWIEWSCKIFNEDVRVILGYNVTERIQLENTYELLVQNAEDLIYQCDVNGNYQFLNQRCFDKLGYAQNELLGRNSMELLPDDYADFVKEFYRNHFEQRIASSYLEFPILTKDEQIIWLGQYVTTLYKPGTKNIIQGFLAVGRDITESREQQETIKQQRDDITASINYAQKIQVNLLPNEDKFNQSFGQSCVMYRPKDIVSGDFYWLEQIDNLVVFALADCTGHGVPGSFMTLLGINLLNNIILEKRILHPSAILDELDKRLMTALPRENGEENMNDGMEISICIFNPANNELSYACAGARFLIYEGNSFSMHKGDSKHIGDKPTQGFKSFVTHHTKFTESSTLYLFTDGFQDQFGGIKNKKYSFRRMLELFEANIRLPLSDQRYMIESEFDKWKSEDVQTDDVTIIALRIPKTQQ